MGLMPGSSNPSLIAQGSVSSNNTTTTNNNDNNNHGMRWADNFDMATVLQLVANIKYQELLRAAHQKREDASTAERQLQQNLRAKKQHHAANPKPRAKKGTNKLDHDGRQEGLAAAASETQHPGNDQSIFATNKMQLSEPHLRLVWCLKRSKAATAAAAAFVSFFGVGPTASAGPADSVETTVPLTSTMVSNKAAGHCCRLMMSQIIVWQVWHILLICAVQTLLVGEIARATGQGNSVRKGGCVGWVDGLYLPPVKSEVLPGLTPPPLHTVWP